MGWPLADGPKLPPSRKPVTAAAFVTGAVVPRSLAEVRELAQLVVDARLAPKGLDTAEACTVGLLLGLELGLPPLSALQRIAIIGGRPTIWGDGALALVRASGLCEAIEEVVDGDRAEDWVAHCTVKRRGDAQSVSRSFSAADAVRAGLWNRPGPWREFPTRMLQMRARAFALRDTFPDALHGLYLREELEEPDEGDAGPGSPPSPQPAPGSAPRGWQSDGPRSREPARSPGTPRRAPPPPGWAPAAAARSERPDPTADPAEVEGSSSTPAVAMADAPEISSSPAPKPASETAPEQDAVFATPLAPEPQVHQAGALTASEQPTFGTPSRELPRPRETLSTRRARDLRYALGWSIRQPRTMPPDRARSPRGAPPRGGRRHRPGSSAGTTSGPWSLPPDSTAILSAEPAMVLVDYDQALACAQDADTLLEIHEEFVVVLGRLASEQRSAAERIHDRHAARVAALQAEIPPDPDGPGDQPMPPRTGEIAP